GAKIKNFPNKINRLMPMTHDKLLKFYLSQGLIVCPSSFETFGNVPIEAACMGVPALVSENMGCAEVFKMAGLENLIVSFNDTKKTVEKIMSLCGQQIIPKKINNLRKILNPRVINAQIMSVIKRASSK
ncbi:MAG: glycosyltransferase, partial [Patescibacteria group bacterium]|nr:glycosyltransferase [Patescibacteria group bacterium]